MLRAVIFDFDGVIANSEPLHFRAYQDVLSAVGVSLSEEDYYSRYLGFDDVGAFEAIAREGGLAWDPADVAALVARKSVRLEQLEGSGSVLFPGAVDAVMRLAAAFPLAIASGARRDEIVRVLEHEGLSSYFRAIVAAEDTPLSKPAPDPYRLAVDRLSAALGIRVEPCDCVAIEDSRWGLESARAAGLKTIAVAHTYPAAELPADLVVPTLAGLTVDCLGSLTAST